MREGNFLRELLALIYLSFCHISDLKIRGINEQHSLYSSLHLILSTFITTTELIYSKSKNGQISIINQDL